MFFWGPLYQEFVLRQHFIKRCLWPRVASPVLILRLCDLATPLVLNLLELLCDLLVSTALILLLRICDLVAPGQTYLLNDRSGRKWTKYIENERQIWNERNIFFVNDWKKPNEMGRSRTMNNRNKKNRTLYIIYSI